MRITPVVLLGLLALFVGVAAPANILGVFTSTSPSHNIVHIEYIKAMVERGHNVTVVTTQPLKDKNPKYHHIYMPQEKKMIDSVFYLLEEQAEPLRNPLFLDLMNNPDNKFDLVIIGYFSNDFHLGIGAHFKCPIVLSFTSAANNLQDRYIGNPPEVAYVTALSLFAPPDPMKFTGRLTNFMINFLWKILQYFLQRHSETLYSEIFPSSKYPPFEETKKMVSLVLLNSHFTDGFIRPHVPAVVEVGGIQIKQKPDPLPENLQKIINASSEHGVIYVSFGSHIKPSDINPQLNENIFKALAGLKQTVLWKWNDAEKPGNAPNIFYESWLPQDDLLANPKVKLFITHAGKGGVIESQYHSVPMVAIPLFFDQVSNAAQVERHGFGLELDQHTLKAEELRTAVLEVLENPKYVKKAQQFSKLYRDRPMNAKDTAVFWLEYVLRHKGAYHMQSPMVHMNSFQYLSLDVIGFLVLVIFLVYKTVTITTKFVFKKISAKLQKIKKH